MPELGLKTYLTFLIENLKPLKFEGSVRIQSRDPRVAPIIEENLFEDTEGIRHMAKMALQIRQLLADHPALVAKYGYINEFQPGPLAATEDQIIEYIKLWTSYGHHMCGTCAMGAVDCKGHLNYKNAVLDSKCRVVGVKNLRVADCSVYATPKVPEKTTFHAYNTSRGAYIVGEIVSEFLLQEHGSGCHAHSRSLNKQVVRKVANSARAVSKKDVTHFLQHSAFSESLRQQVAKTISGGKQEK